MQTLWHIKPSSTPGQFHIAENGGHSLSSVGFQSIAAALGAAVDEANKKRYTIRQVIQLDGTRMLLLIDC